MRVVIMSRDAPAQTGIVIEREWSGREKVERDALEAANSLAKWADSAPKASLQA